MCLTRVGMFGVGVLALAVMPYTVVRAQTGDAKAKYARMAPVEQYLMPDRSAEIALARTAAPASISADAEILVLGPHGYKTAVKGTNGFGCLVDRGWDAGFDAAEFWNPKIRGPVCYNAPAVRSILPLVLERARLALGGLTTTQIKDSITAFAQRGVPLQPGSMCYMMSKEAYLTDREGHDLSHLMFYTPRVDGSVLGADRAGSPVILGQESVPGTPSPVTEYYVAVPTWSDGTPATGHDSRT
jgi:hypothetical protein